MCDLWPSIKRTAMLPVWPLHITIFSAVECLHPPPVALLTWKDHCHECGRSVAVIEQVWLEVLMWVHLQARDKCKTQVPVCTDSVCTHPHCQPRFQYPDSLPCEVRGQR